MNKKKCSFCGSETTIKYGKFKNLTKWKCIPCNRQFTDSSKCIDIKNIWVDYTRGKQTYVQLAQKYNCSTKTIQRKLDTIKPVMEKTFNKVANVIMDITYFGRNFGVMVFKDSISSQILLKKYVHTETNYDYLEGVKEIVRRGICVQCIIWGV